MCRKPMTDLEVAERKRKIVAAIAEGKNQKAFAEDELNISVMALHKFMDKHGMSKWYETKRAKVEAALAKVAANGSNNATMEEFGKTFRVDRVTLSQHYIKPLKAANPDFAWQRGGLLDETLLVRKAVDDAIKNGSVRFAFIRAFANPFPCVAIPSSCAATRLSVAAPSQVGRARLCSKSR
jgi:hypothetical protein